MTSLSRTLWPALLVCAIAGCDAGTPETNSAGNAAPPTLIPPAPVASSTSTERPAASSDQATDVKLEPVKFDAFLAQMANKNAKLTMVDCWATWCGPCKENFPHVVEMNTKYGDKGLAVVSLSFDDPTNSKQVAEAKAFLQSKKAAFTNLLLDEEEGVGFEKLNINAIPAVFLYGPDGKELKRFTLDDPNNQFTYDDVEKTVASLLEGKTPGK